MALISSRRVKINFNFFGGRPREHFSSNDQALKLFIGEINKTTNRIGKVAEKIGVNEVQLDAMFTNVGWSLLSTFKSKFMNNPSDWPALSKTTQQVREYGMNPQKLKEDFISKTTYTSYTDEKGIGRWNKVSLFTPNVHKGLSKKFKEDPEEVSGTGRDIDYDELMNRINNFFDKLQPLTIYDSTVTPKGPALLFSGFLMNSMNFKLVKRASPKRGKMSYIRDLNFSIARQGIPHVLGGSTEVYTLKITRIPSKMTKSSKEYVFYFNIPEKWAKRFHLLHLGPNYKIEIIPKIINLPVRNPFLLEDENIEALRDLNRYFDVHIPRQVEKEMRKAIVG